MDEKIVTLHDFSSDFGTALKRRGNNFGSNNNKAVKNFWQHEKLLLEKQKLKMMALERDALRILHGIVC